MHLPIIPEPGCDVVNSMQGWNVDRQSWSPTPVCRFALYPLMDASSEHPCVDQQLCRESSGGNGVDYD